MRYAATVNQPLFPATDTTIPHVLCRCQMVDPVPPDPSIHALPPAALLSHRLAVASEHVR